MADRRRIEYACDLDGVSQRYVWHLKSEEPGTRREGSPVKDKERPTKRAAAWSSRHHSITAYNMLKCSRRDQHRGCFKRREAPVRAAARSDSAPVHRRGRLTGAAVAPKLPMLPGSYLHAEHHVVCHMRSMTAIASDPQLRVLRVLE